ncbi:hypothetical protein CsatB_016891 [Cannabis sativa]
MLVQQEDINLMWEEMRSENYAEASIYLILPGPLIPLEWREDVDAIKNVPEPSQTLRRCKIEELPEVSSRVVDIVVNPPDQKNTDDYIYKMFVAFGDLLAQGCSDEVLSDEIQEPIELSSISSSDAETNAEHISEPPQQPILNQNEGKDQNPDWEMEEEYNAFLERLEDLGGNESDDEIILARAIFDVEP